MSDEGKVEKFKPSEQWLREKAKEEDGVQFSVGGLVGDLAPVFEGGDEGKVELPKAVCINDGTGEYAIIRKRPGTFFYEQLSKGCPSIEEAWQDAFRCKEARVSALEAEVERLRVIGARGA